MTVSGRGDRMTTYRMQKHEVIDAVPQNQRKKPPQLSPLTFSQTDRR